MLSYDYDKILACAESISRAGGNSDFTFHDGKVCFTNGMVCSRDVSEIQKMYSLLRDSAPLPSAWTSNKNIEIPSAYSKDGEQRIILCPSLKCVYVFSENMNTTISFADLNTIRAYSDLLIERYGLIHINVEEINLLSSINVVCAKFNGAIRKAANIPDIRSFDGIQPIVRTHITRLFNACACVYDDYY